jgi:hypothetical protein
MAGIIAENINTPGFRYWFAENLSADEFKLANCGSKNTQLNTNTGLSFWNIAFLYITNSYQK